MKKNAKKLLVTLLIGGMVLSHADMVSAADIPTEAVYDLEVGGTQEFIIQDADGEKATVIVEEIPGNARVDAGTYKVQYDALGWTAGFYVKVSNNKFISVYSSFYSLNWGSISDVKLTKNSDIKATLSFIYKAVAVFDTGVIAKISNGNLVVSKR